MSQSPPPPTSQKNLTVSNQGPVYLITLHKPPENRITRAFAQELIAAFRHVEAQLKADPSEGGAVITRGSDDKFWCTGLDLDEGERDAHASTDGFYPLLATILDFPYPTIALLTGHTFGGGCLLALAHDYRIMNASRGFFSMPPVNLGLHFEGIGLLPRLKLQPQVARRVLLEAHKFTSSEALSCGIVDELATPKTMLEVALTKAREVASRAKMGVFSLLRNELYGDASKALRAISYVHGRATSLPAKAKI